MKKRRGPAKKATEVVEVKPEEVTVTDEEPNEGFSTWLKQGEGVEYMKLYKMVLGRMVQGVLIVGMVGWYSVGIWQVMDQYFRDEYQKHLKNIKEGDQEIRIASKLPRPSVLVAIDEQFSEQCEIPIFSEKNCVRDTFPGYISNLKLICEVPGLENQDCTMK